MFDLDQAIARWRRDMTAAEIKSPAVLDELESHLREDVERRLKSSQPIEQAFESAVQQIGKPEALRREFAEANKASPLRRWNWLVAICVAFPIACLARRAIVLTKLFGLWYWNWSPTERVLGCVAIGALIVAVCSWLFIHRFLPGIADRRKLVAMLIAGSAAGPLWFLFLPEFVLPPHSGTGRLIVTMLWLMVPCAVLPGIIYGLERASRRATAAGS